MTVLLASVSRGKHCCIKHSSCLCKDMGEQCYDIVSQLQNKKGKCALCQNINKSERQELYIFQLFKLLLFIISTFFCQKYHELNIISDTNGNILRFGETKWYLWGNMVQQIIELPLGECMSKYHFILMDNFLALN